MLNVTVWDGLPVLTPLHDFPDLCLPLLLPLLEVTAGAVVPKEGCRSISSFCRSLFLLLWHRAAEACSLVCVLGKGWQWKVVVVLPLGTLPWSAAPAVEAFL